MDLSEQSTEFLLKQANYQTNQDTKTAYDASWTLIKRFSQQVDLEFLIDLLRSEDPRDRSRGTYFLSEMRGGIQRLKEPVTRLADDYLSESRRVFVDYVGEALYDEETAKGLAKCLLDLNLFVRCAVIDWAVRVSDDTLESFVRCVESGGGMRKFKFHDPQNNEFWKEAERKRALRGLDIIQRLRTEEDIEEIRKIVPDEDSFVFDHLIFRDDISPRRRIRPPE